LTFSSGVDGNHGRFDDLIVYPLTTSTLFTPSGAGYAYQDVDVRTRWTSVANTQAGMWIAGDAANPANAVHVNHNGTNIMLNQIVAGVYTNKISVAAAYVANAVMRVTKAGDVYTLYYNGANIGSTTITGMTGTICGLFSTYAGNTCSEFEVIRNG
jgi:hypothetical protein